MKWEVFTALYALSHLKQIKGLSKTFVNASRFLNFSRQQELHCTYTVTLGRVRAMDVPRRLL